jgi:hypothetical protein
MKIDFVLIAFICVLITSLVFLLKSTDVFSFQLNLMMVLISLICICIRCRKEIRAMLNKACR